MDQDPACLYNTVAEGLIACFVEGEAPEGLQLGCCTSLTSGWTQAYEISPDIMGVREALHRTRDKWKGVLARETARAIPELPNAQSAGQAHSLPGSVL